MLLSVVQQTGRLTKHSMSFSTRLGTLRLQALSHRQNDHGGACLESSQDIKAAQPKEESDRSLSRGSDLHALGYEFHCHVNVTEMET